MPSQLEYYRHFCVPEFKNLQKVRGGAQGARGFSEFPLQALRPGSPLPTQAPVEVLKDKECPAMIIPSTPRTSGGLTSRRALINRGSLPAREAAAWPGCWDYFWEGLEGGGGVFGGGIWRSVVSTGRGFRLVSRRALDGSG